MRASEWRKLTKEEIEVKLKELQEELFKLRFQHATGQLENIKRLSLVRKDIARIKTILNEQKR
ncbi:Ribosomal protein L29 [Candidatus Desulfofervidus auxilii]|uniref:Large ribosomal subunit protein uL29 n=1 Tax=Desulfofervidus auxilii TaxID=1621989 RepID=A0A7C2A7J1_DESA2|nr:50S ribosomal protein L29 [Candidatus Desulfofervidus auxilii]CAD7770975.1 MAG: 50S ribosomal protein L29 [Candidatus Methanoperedenaceae archaeon GB50]CAD7772464.1 50S ribosomal protein L29 [Candidatus Methanoperedenaceae archaeon GB37]AMM40279.1 Ribosomal protein L29 [Candidatus Desulfofervidus auxilii]MDL1966708.1 50S ribosomal protein L29 [Candidatus Desulfofervidus auxilii]CAD7771312.1 50S ribosomal protein L29 [Candidatus Methanoperedenaceae archaeon GB50]